MRYMKSSAIAACVFAGLVCNSFNIATAQTASAVVPTPAPIPVAAETPESVVARYTRAVQRRDWKTSAALMHPDALRQLKRLFRPAVIGAPNLGIGKTFFNVSTAAQFDRLSSAQIFERLMTATTRINPEVSAALATSKSQILGHVLEAPETAHVVYRITLKTQGVSITKIAVMPVKKIGNTWGGLLSGDIEGMAAAFSRATAPRAVPQTPRNSTPTRVKVRQ